MNAIEKLLNTLEYSQHELDNADIDSARAELAALREVAVAAGQVMWAKGLPQPDNANVESRLQTMFAALSALSALAQGGAE